MMNYHDANKKFPPAGFLERASNNTSVPAGSDTKRHWSWLTLVLPFMEQGGLYDDVDETDPGVAAAALEEDSKRTGVK